MAPTCKECLKAINRNTDVLLAMGRGQEAIGRRLSRIESSLALVVQDKRDYGLELGLVKDRMRKISELVLALGATDRDPEPEPTGG